MAEPVQFRVDSTGAAVIVSDPTGSCYVTNTGDLVVRNREYLLQVFKHDSYGYPLEGCHFDLRYEVNVNGFISMDHNVISGFADMVSTNDGQIVELTEALPVDVYYIREFSLPSGYEMMDPVRFEITNTGEVVTTTTDHARVTSEVVDNKLVYTMVITNERIPIEVPTGVFLQVLPAVVMLVVAGAGIGAVIYFSKKKKNRK
jgi:hypothetical protein